MIHALIHDVGIEADLLAGNPAATVLAVLIRVFNQNWRTSLFVSLFYFKLF